MEQITNSHRLPHAADRRQADIAGSKRAEMSDVPGLQPATPGVQVFVRFLVILAAILLLLALAWVILGPPTFLGLILTIAITFLFISALGISNNGDNRRPPGR